LPPLPVDSPSAPSQEFHGKEEHEKSEDQPTPVRKKVAARKGWWQRLLE
jgi:hypothetical protein